MAKKVARSGEQFAELDNGLTICHETFGDAADPAVLLVMGLGGHMTWWRAEFCEKLAARGMYVIRMDNRDVGRSSRVHGSPRVKRGDIVRGFVTKKVTPPYTLSDMAGDCVGLLDHLQIKQANIVGVSLGGMIAQTLAIEYPDRVLSLVSMMSTTGRRLHGFQNPKMLVNLFRPVGKGKEGYVEGAIRAARLIASPGFAFDEEAANARAEETYERGFTAAGVIRQIMAAAVQPDRTPHLQKLEIPVTVIHGRRDPLVHISGGRATAKAVPGADFIEIHGLAHDLPAELDDYYIDAIIRTAERAHQA